MKHWPRRERRRRRCMISQLARQGCRARGPGKNTASPGIPTRGGFAGDLQGICKERDFFWIRIKKKKGKRGQPEDGGKGRNLGETGKRPARPAREHDNTTVRQQGSRTARFMTACWAFEKERGPLGVCMRSLVVARSREDRG